MEFAALVFVAVMAIGLALGTLQTKQSAQHYQEQPASENRGSDQIPLIVKIIPPEKTPEEKKHEAKKDKNGRKMATFTEGLFLATSGLALFTGVLAGAAFLQMRQGRRSIIAAERGAAAAERALTVVERAYLSVDALGIEDLHVRPIGRFKIMNSGNLPAQGVRWFPYAEIDADGDRKIFTINDSDIPPSTNIIAPRGEMRRFFDANFSDIGLHQFETGEAFLYVWGIVYYMDGFRTWRWLRFCHRYNSDCLETRDVVGRTAWDVGADRVRQHQYGNSTDEDIDE